MKATRDTAEEYARLKEVLADLSELPAQDRLKEAQGRLADNPDLLGRVTQILEDLDSDDTFLEKDLPSQFGARRLIEDSAARRAAAANHHPGDTLGHFEILDVLGQGGMAVVYRALQRDPVERVVALKVISAHSTESQQQRFIRECGILARLSHPHVATMYDSGISASGEPWVAMELVEGPPITEACTKDRLSPEQRVELFIGACEGLAHAHRKGVLHRDVKPSNLLVRRVGGQPVVKVIDFGIAAALGPGDHIDSELTGRHLIGTPAYMSPESAHLTDRQALDMRSDVYALGVVLCELLCGTRPYDEAHLSLADWVNRLTSRDIPSVHVLFERLEPERQTRIADSMGVTPGGLKRRLRSDLGLVVRKSLARESEQRYASASEFADDLRRWLAGEAVLAHAPSTSYQLRKFVRRHWIGVLATLMVFVSLAGGLVARDIETRRARQAQAESDAISTFLIDLLEHASPLREEGDEVLLQDIIDHGSESLDERFADQPAVKARLLHTLGRVNGERGEYERGAELLSKSLAIMEQEYVGNEVERLEVISDLGVALRRLGRLNEAQELLENGLAGAEDVEAEHPLLVADLANSLGNAHVIKEDWAQAERYHRRALALREANLPAGDLKVTASYNNLSTVLINSWQPQAALPIARRVLQEWQANLPPGHPWIGIARNNLSVALARVGKEEESLALNMEALREAEQRLGPKHPDVADFWRNVSVTLGHLGRREEAVDAMQRHVDILSGALGPDVTRTLMAERRLVATRNTVEYRFEESLTRLDDIRRRLLQGEPNDSLLFGLIWTVPTT